MVSSSFLNVFLLVILYLMVNLWRIVGQQLVLCRDLHPANSFPFHVFQLLFGLSKDCFQQSLWYVESQEKTGQGGQLSHVPSKISKLERVPPDSLSADKMQ